MSSIINTHLFLKYKGIPNPIDFVKQAKSYHFKIKKYAYWSAVHASENSKKILLEVHSSLTNSGTYDIAHYAELSAVWEKVQRWKIDKDNLTIEPPKIVAFERFEGALKLGSTHPDFVDEILFKFGWNYNEIEVEKRWDLFLAVQLIDFLDLENTNNFLSSEIIKPNKFENQNELLEYIEKIIKLLYSNLGFDLNFESEDYSGVLKLFIEELGLSYEAKNTLRSNKNISVSFASKVLLSYYEGSQTELVKFNFAKNDMMIKVNSGNRFLNSAHPLAKTFMTDEFWELSGQALINQLGDLEVVQQYFDNLAKVLRRY